jgi:hypothetical protein
MGNSYRFHSGELDSVPTGTMTHEQTAKARAGVILPATKESIELTDDWEMYKYEGAMDLKYGRFIYSKKLDQIRHSTIGEFYGDALVD